MSNIQVPIPSSKFEGQTSNIEEQLMQFRGLHEAVNKTASNTLHKWTVLEQQLKEAQPRNTAVNCSLDYSPAVETVRAKKTQLLQERKKMEEFCGQREKRWTLCLQRNQLLVDTDKVILNANYRLKSEFTLCAVIS